MSTRSAGGNLDPATQLALARLAQSRHRLQQRIEAAAQARVAGGASGFQPRSATLRMLLSLGRVKFPWLRMAVPAFILLRSLRRR
jgi:hypothetical protein